MNLRSGPLRFISYNSMAPVLTGLLFAITLLASFFKHLRGFESYPDIVAGYTTFWGLDKSQDFRALGLLIALLALLPLLVASLCRFVAPGGYRSANGRAVQQLLLFSLIPAAWRLAVDCAVPRDHVPQFKIVCLFPGLALIALVMLSRYRRNLTPDNVLISGGAIILAVVFGAFTGYSVGLFCVRLIPGSYRWLQGAGANLACGCAITSLIMLVCIFARSATVELFQARVLTWLRLCQYPLVLLFFQLVPPPFVDPHHRFSETYPAGLVAVLSLCVGVCWYLMRRRFGSVPDPSLGFIHNYPLARSIAPLALAAVVVFVYCISATLPAVAPDDFHWGEQALPWQQLIHFHKIPYVEFVPIHGLMSYVRGACSSLFFDGTAASYTASDILLMGIACTALTLALCRVVSPLGALILLGGAMPVSDRMYFFVPALLAIAAPQLHSKPVRLLIVWMVVTVLMTGYNPTQGPAFAVGTLPVALWAFWRACRSDRAGLVKIGVAIIAVAGGLLLISPVRQILFAFVRFVADNSYTDAVAHGIPWTEGMHKRAPLTGAGSSQFLWELTRWFWILMVFICGVVFWRQAFNNRRHTRSRASDPAKTSLLILSASIPLYLLCWSPWIIGRIFPGIYAYAGDISHVCIYWLVPTLVLLAVRARRLAPAMLVLAVVSGFFYPENPTPIDPDELREKCVVVRTPPLQFPFTDGALIGMPNMGKVVTPPNLKYLVPIKAFLDHFLKPGETYLDFTNRTAIYYYLDLPYPTRYTPFVAANSRLQAGQIQQLQDHPVPAALISPNIMIDQISPTLREYFVFRRYATTFSLVSTPDYTFLVDPVRGAALSPPAELCGTPRYISDLDSACYFMGYLHRLPISWGHAWQNLQPLFSPVVDMDPATPSNRHDLIVENGMMKPAGRDVYLQYAIPPQAASGQKADFLLLHFNSKLAGITDPDAPPDDARFQFTFNSRSMDSGSRPFSFDAAPGDLLVPLGAFPRWLLAKDLISIRLTLLNPQRVKSFNVTRMAFLHLDDPRG